jgi:formylglycine-generating enzyme required for sulfatase activity
LNTIQGDFTTVDDSEKDQKSLTLIQDAYDSQKNDNKITIQSKILDKQFFSKSDWVYVPQDISETELSKIVKKAVNKKIAENDRRPTRFSEIPGIEKSWLNKKRVEDQNWQNKFRDLHREWQRSFSTLSRSKSDFARRKLLESAIAATEKSISSLKRQRKKEQKSLINELGKIRHSILIWGKAVFGTGVSQDLTLSQVKDQINQYSGILSIKEVNGVHIRNLSIVKNNRLIKDQIQSETKGHYRTASLYPEDVSTIVENENEEEWVYLFQKIEVYPFTQRTGRLNNIINKKIEIKGGSLIILDQIKPFLAKEKIKNEALNDWLKEELINMNEENSEIENEIQLTIQNYKKRDNEIIQDIEELEKRFKELNKELRILPDHDDIKEMKNTFFKIKREYKEHHSQRSVIDFRKIYDSPTSGQRLKDAFTTMVIEAWNSYNVNVGDYTEEILVEKGKLESYTERQLHWKPMKSAFQILYLTRRKAGSQTQYIVNISIYIHLIDKDFVSCNYENVNDKNKLQPFKEEVQTSFIPFNQITSNDLKDVHSKTLTNHLGMEFVLINAGSFMMGSPSNESGRDSDEKQHEVILTKDYYMQTTEVTQGQWKAVMGNNPSSFQTCGDNCPVENVSWDDTQEFIKKVNQMGDGYYRLPTEAEWEYAARAGTTTSYSFGNDSNQLSKFGNFCDSKCTYGWKDRNQNDQYNNTAPVKSYSPNAWRLYDMHGNVWEWCNDWYGDYPDISVTDPGGPSSGLYRVLRGGGWNNYAQYCRSAKRDSLSPGSRISNFGLRLSRTP